jgi:CheY-like chemotaxis protein
MSAQDQVLTFLLVEDNADDATLFSRMLREVGRRVEHVSSVEAAKNRLDQRGIDAVLLDLHLPDSAGIEGARRFLRMYPDVPVVVLTGLDDERVGQRAVNEGAQDYLVKDQVDRRLLDRSLRYSIERKRAERALARLAAMMSGMCEECGQKLMPEERARLLES